MGSRKQKDELAHRESVKMELANSLQKGGDDAEPIINNAIQNSHNFS